MMENKKPVSGKTKANRILLIAVALVLCIGAVVAGIAASIAHNRTTVGLPGSDTSDTGTNTPDTGASGTPLTFSAPAVGTVAKGHDLTLPVYSNTLGEYRTHNGIDITCDLGSTVRAAAPGIVTGITDDPLLGKSVTLTHSGGYQTVYRNLGEELPAGIAMNVSVAAGAAVGTVGESAISESCDEPHLHFEMTLSGTPLNPLDYIAEDSITTSLSFED